MDTSSVSDRIEYLGKCAGSLRRLDKAAGLPPGHAHALTGRIIDPHLSTLHKIADGAGVPRSWVTNGDGDTPSADAVREAIARACDEPTAAVITLRDDDDDEPSLSVRPSRPSMVG